MSRKYLTSSAMALALLASANAFAAPDKKTERTWKANCASCHGPEGKADTEKGQKMKMADISTAAWQKKATDADIRKAIVDGVSETKDGVKKEMDSFKEKLKPDQVDALVAYVRSLAK